MTQRNLAIRAWWWVTDAEVGGKQAGQVTSQNRITAPLKAAGQAHTEPTRTGKWLNTPKEFKWLIYHDSTTPQFWTISWTIFKKRELGESRVLLIDECATTCDLLRQDLQPRVCRFEGGGAGSGRKAYCIIGASKPGRFYVKLRNMMNNNSERGSTRGSCNHYLWQESSLALQHLLGLHQWWKKTPLMCSNMNIVLPCLVELECSTCHTAEKLCYILDESQHTVSI